MPPGNERALSVAEHYQGRSPLDPRRETQAPFVEGIYSEFQQHQPYLFVSPLRSDVGVPEADRQFPAL